MSNTCVVCTGGTINMIDSDRGVSYCVRVTSKIQDLVLLYELKSEMTTDKIITILYLLGM